jgi:phosphoribosylaminoimidazole-succinocarboxamide synthase
MTVIHQTDFPNLYHRGKIRDTYNLGEGLLLMVSTDRISAFDVVLPTAIPDKGLVLSQLSAFWFDKTAHLIPNHMVTLAHEESRLNEDIDVNSLLDSLTPEIAGRSMVVREARRIDVECVVRGYLAGSAWAEYQVRGNIQGQVMSEGLREGDRFNLPIFTPTTKAETDHDQPLTWQELEDTVGPSLARQLEEKSLEIYSFASDYACSRGLILADTKMEFGLLDDQLILIDELLTPDSSRFWEAEGYQPGRPQPNFDKQYVRDYLVKTGWDREPPAPGLPSDVVEKTRSSNLEAFRRLTGQELS